MKANEFNAYEMLCDMEDDTNLDISVSMEKLRVSSYIDKVLYDPDEVESSSFQPFMDSFLGMESSDIGNKVASAYYKVLSKFSQLVEYTLSVFSRWLKGSENARESTRDAIKKLKDAIKYLKKIDTADVAGKEKEYKYASYGKKLLFTTALIQKTNLGINGLATGMLSFFEEDGNIKLKKGESDSETKTFHAALRESKDKDMMVTDMTPAKVMICYTKGINAIVNSLVTDTMDMDSVISGTETDTYGDELSKVYDITSTVPKTGDKYDTSDDLQSTSQVAKIVTEFKDSMDEDVSDDDVTATELLSNVKSDIIAVLALLERTKYEDSANAKLTVENVNDFKKTYVKLKKMTKALTKDDRKTSKNTDNVKDLTGGDATDPKKIKPAEALDAEYNKEAAKMMVRVTKCGIHLNGVKNLMVMDVRAFNTYMKKMETEVYRVGSIISKRNKR